MLTENSVRSPSIGETRPATATTSNAEDAYREASSTPAKSKRKPRSKAIPPRVEDVAQATTTTPPAKLFDAYSGRFPEEWGVFTSEICAVEEYTRRHLEIKATEECFGDEISIAQAMTPSNQRWILKCLKFALWISRSSIPWETPLMLFCVAQIEFPRREFYFEHFFLPALIAKLRDFKIKYDAAEIWFALCELKGKSFADFEEALLRFADNYWQDSTHHAFAEMTGKAVAS